MLVISLTLPKNIERSLKEEAERTGASEEELIIESLAKTFDENSTQRQKLRCT
jgi:hypothetical protein